MATYKEDSACNDNLYWPIVDERLAFCKKLSMSMVMSMSVVIIVICTIRACT